MLFVCTRGSSSHHIALKPIINRAGLLIQFSGFGFNQSLHSSGCWMIRYTVNIVLEDLTKLFPGVWENQEFNGWQQCADVRKNQIHSINKKSHKRGWSECQESCSARLVWPSQLWLKQQRKTKGRFEKYVRTWWVEAVTQHLITRPERQSLFVCVLVANLLWTGIEQSKTVCLFKRGTWRLVPCSLARCWCCCGQVHTHGYAWFCNHSSIGCFSGFPDLNQILTHHITKKKEKIIVIFFFKLSVCPAVCPANRK